MRIFSGGNDGKIYADYQLVTKYAAPNVGLKRASGAKFPQVAL